MEEANNLKNVMITYSKSLKNKEKYIYVGTEKITSQERHPVKEFQYITPIYLFTLLFNKMLIFVLGINKNTNTCVRYYKFFI